MTRYALAIERPLNINQAARFLGLRRGTVYNMVSRRAIPFHKVGRRVLFTKEELEAWFASTLVPCTPRPAAQMKKGRAKVNVEAIVKDAVDHFTQP